MSTGSPIPDTETASMTNRLTIILPLLLIACCAVALPNAVYATVVGGPAGTAAVEKPVLTVTVDTDEQQANPGDTITYTVTITNTGDATATALVLDDVLPTGFTTAAGTTTYHYAFGSDLDAGQSVTAAYAVAIDDAVTAGNYTDAVTVSAAFATSVNSSASVRVVIPEVKGAETEATEEPDTLAETGVGQLDVFMVLLGATLVAWGAIGLRRLEPAS